MASKYLNYYTMLDLSPKLAPPLGFPISVNDTSLLVVAQTENQGVTLGSPFPSTQLVSRHIWNPCATFHVQHCLLNPAPTSLSSRMLQPCWLSFFSSTTSSLLFTVVTSDHSHPHACC